MTGTGRRRRVHRGRGVMDVIKKVAGMLHGTNIISGLARRIPYVGPALGGVASALGFGRKRRRVHRGRGVLSGLLGAIGLGRPSYMPSRRIGAGRRRVSHMGGALSVAMRARPISHMTRYRGIGDGRRRRRVIRRPRTFIGGARLTRGGHHLMF